ncbi:MAG: hypothetical protein A3G49_02725 [Candidatus Sungbacteria bacterium RIFCSPLOWO2_12_FULL_41_11]|uniref:Uncharacterized protein n=1 Tax=Candidatus Sungbacteria bacterium RIFCSPLOWO2_12_FULL_41_11 TaxID=1802286 RepID=A0A1G2LTL1_9BACT|nr:MAG: hypothetical protein A3D41_01925 [Candidatus Sungbacteria bacterium RIFCSPHIGHO2_02_FULL_41_12b]OHA14131.1 MAG: hypothetical protein A3G49_02725 [Candidatus Sungbacteria bacterium RIFCSPLOWO2_12_FULL_41_11]
MGISFCLFGLSFWFEDTRANNDVFFAFTVFLLGYVFVVGAGTFIIKPFNAIRKFRKEFKFLPPVTPEARDALQRKVDDCLGVLARSFFYNCSEEKRLLEILRGFVSGEAVPTSIFCEDVANFENWLCRTRKHLQESKKRFWRLHAIARNQFLPQPFKMLDKVGDYKDVTFYNPAKHKKDEARE